MSVKLKDLKSIIATNRIYLWFKDGDCSKVFDKDSMFKTYGECEVKSIYDDTDPIEISHIDIVIDTIME